ncbi:MAG: hypothetical protein HFP81_09050 [Methylococcales symbiont of Hymedesmia sp. n. MRB-2018]|nr:MAG: hypothetical protein HFP78_09150 [Methylococcales symbiont of Hymedesmia sp. n. MRB-2018]KAF3983109.1 MAG: hypothetical protein HFP81_09050 [Methylococcales symbiont of Hymedesmia sp. n. MRB-2018]
MSFKISLTKTVIKWTPNKLVSWIANIVLKDIGALTGFSFDLEMRKVYLQIQLVGESETIDVWLEGFGIISDGDDYKVIIKQAESNRIWLSNILSRVVNKEWKIPLTSQMAPYIEFMAELLEVESMTVEENN